MTTTYADAGGLAHAELIDVLDGRVREIVRRDASTRNVTRAPYAASPRAWSATTTTGA